MNFLESFLGSANAEQYREVEPVMAALFEDAKLKGVVSKAVLDLLTRFSDTHYAGWPTDVNMTSRFTYTLMIGQVAKALEKMRGETA